MITASDVMESDHLKVEIKKTIDSNGWAILMEVAKNSLMRPPDPRSMPVHFGHVDPNHVAPILYGISLGMWQMVDMFTQLHEAEDISKMEPIPETYGSKEIMESDDFPKRKLKVAKDVPVKKEGNSNAENIN